MSRNEKEIVSQQKKIEALNKENSRLIDQHAEDEAKLNGIDKLYKEIIDKKDETIKEYIKISSSNNQECNNFRRLLIKFRADNELKQIRKLKEEIEKNENEQSVLDKESSLKKDVDDSERAGKRILTKIKWGVLIWKKGR